MTATAKPLSSVPKFDRQGGAVGATWEARSVCTESAFHEHPSFF